MTARDAWAAPFHTLLGLTEPRRANDLPDLSGHVPSAASVAARSEPAHWPEERVPVPEYFRDFADQADLVWLGLRKAGEPETLRPIAESGVRRAAEISEVFARAAERHRATAAVKWPAPTSRTT